MKLTKKLTAISIISAVIISAFSFTALGATKINGSDVADFAVKFEGCGYKYSSKGPDKFDCSGLVYYVLKNFGITFGNSTSEYNTKEKARSFGTVINNMEDAKKGDIVVWKSHTAVYLGEGRCISAMNAKKGVIINQVEKFVDKNGVTNPSHFFIRPFDYAEETEKAEPVVAETQTNTTAQEAPKLSFKEKISLMCDRIEEFIKSPFMPIVNAFN